MAIAGKLLAQGAETLTKTVSKKLAGKTAKTVIKEAPVAKVLPFIEWKHKLKKKGSWPKLAPQHETMLERQYGATNGDDAANMAKGLEDMTSKDPDIKEAGAAWFNEYSDNLIGFQEAQDQGIKMAKQYQGIKEGKAVRQGIAEKLIEQPDFKPRQDLFYIMDTGGDKKRISGTDNFLKKYQETGEIDPKELVLQSTKKTKASKGKRYKIMSVPRKETTAEFHRRFPNDPERAEKLAKEYNKTRMSGYHQTADFARKNGLTTTELLEELRTGNKKILTQAEKNQRTQFQSGHGHSVNAPENPRRPRPDDSPLHNPPTSRDSTWIEEAIENISGGNKVEHDLNPYVADKIGMPYTWMEDIDLFIDRYTSKGNHKLPMWQRDFSLDELDSLMNIAGDADEETVEKVFAALMDKRKDPNHRRVNFIEQLRAIQQDVNRSQGGRDVLTGKTDVAPPNISDMMERGLERP